VIRRRDLLTAVGGVLVGAQSRAETLVVVTESGQNSLDPQGLGVNQAGFGISWNVYDRLIGFGTRTLEDGNRSFDFATLVPELAAQWQFAADGNSVTFFLRRDAIFHDGAPVTARDVKWSLDRAVSNPAPASQMRAGSLQKPEQFVVVDDHTIRVDFLDHSRLTMPDLAVIQPAIFNSALCLKHATADDPWAMAWTRTNAAGSGAFSVESWTPRQETVLVRNETWVCGKRPAFGRIVVREIPSAGNRRAMLQRGDADISFDLPPRDYAELSRDRKFSILGVPAPNTFQYIGMNTRKPPFDDVRVRQAVAWALPYEKIFATALQGRARKLFNGAANSGDLSWPQPFFYHTDFDRARALLGQAGLAGGFATSLSFDLGTATVDEPIALFVQEALGGIGIKADITRLPPGQLRGAIARRDPPFYLFSFGAWFDTVDYFFSLLYDGALTSPSNGAAFENPAVHEAIADARKNLDPQAIRTMISTAMQDVPYIPLVQPFVNVAMQKDIGGYVNMFHRQLDYRLLTHA
jgi:peptide/nickel transport system substrate-binding protein